MAPITTKSLLGNSLLYQDLQSNRASPFLRRNLSQALDHHENRQHNPKDTLDQVSNGAVGHSNRDEIHRDKFALPPLHMQRALAANQEPRLSVDIKTIRKGHRALSDDYSPDETPRKRPRLDGPLRCSVRCLISDSHDSSNVLFAQWKKARILPRRDGRNNFFDVELEEAFTLTSEDLDAPLGDSTRQNSSSQYILQLVFQLDAVSARGLLPALGVTQDLTKATAEDLQLSAIWRRLPQCPSQGESLRLVRGKNGQKLTFNRRNVQEHELNYRLEVDMSWIPKAMTLLQLWGQYQRFDENIY